MKAITKHFSQFSWGYHPRINCHLLNFPRKKGRRKRNVKKSPYTIRAPGFSTSIVRIRSAIEWWRRSCWYVRVKRNAPRRCGIFSKANDRDIKKGRATSCPAGGHWRGINHPREGLHFNAPGWISSEARRTVARAPETADSRPWAALLCIARNDTATGVSEVCTPRYRCRERVSGKPPYDQEGQLSETRTNKLHSFHSLSLPLTRTRPPVTSAESFVDSRRKSASTKQSGAPFDQRLALHPDDRFHLRTCFTRPIPDFPRGSTEVK